MDFVYTYLPEHALQLKNHFHNITNTRPVFFGYSAYLEIPKTTPYEKSVLRNHYAGLMELNSCGVNSQATKDTVMKYAPTCLPGEDVVKLDKILEPLPRGWDNVDGFERRGYFTELSGCWVGVCGQSQHTGWANSASDGMSVGVPYIFYDADYYEQYAKDGGVYFKNDEDFLNKMNKMLDDESYRNKKSKRSSDLGKQNSWDGVIPQYNDHFLRAEKEFKIVSETDTYKRIVDYIHKHRYITKSELVNHLKWGKGIPFHHYRNRLRNEPTIKLTKRGYGVK